MKKPFILAFILFVSAGIYFSSSMDNRPTNITTRRLREIGDVEVLSKSQIKYLFKESLQSNPYMLVRIMQYGKTIVNDQPQNVIERSLDQIIAVAQKAIKNRPLTIEIEDHEPSIIEILQDQAAPRPSISEDGEELTHECIWQMGQK